MVVTFALLGLILGSTSLGAGGTDGSVQVTTTADANAYALVQGNHWISTNTSIDDLQRLRRQFPGDFLWFRKGNRSYLIRDDAVLLQAKGAFASLRSLDPERAELARRERALDRKEEGLEREEEALDQLRDSFDDEDDGGKANWVSESERRDLERRQRELESRRRPLEEEQRKVEAFERSLEAKEEVLEKKAEVDLWILIGRALANGLATPVTSAR